MSKIAFTITTTKRTPDEIILDLAARFRVIRKRKGVTQKELSERSGVSYGSVKRFEETGQISLISLTRLAAALGCSNEMKNLFTEVPYQTIEEVLGEQK